MDYIIDLEMHHAVKDFYACGHDWITESRLCEDSTTCNNCGIFVDDDRAYIECRGSERARNNHK